MEYKDYYKTLGLNKKASADEIKQAYRKLARKYHPDVSKEPNAEEQFKNVQEAYEVLKDSEKRNAYDQLGSQWQSGQDFRPPPNWQSQHTRFYTGDGAQGFNDEEGGGFSDFFSQLFGRSRRGGMDPDTFAGFKRRGSDQHAKIPISLEDAYHGTTKMLQMQVPEVDQQTGDVQHKLHTIKVTIPAGATEGQQLRLAKQGNPGMGGAPSGDLYLEINIEPHPFFTLQGRDIYLTLPVTPWEAALGTEIKTPTLGGLVGLKLAAGSKAGQKLRLKGRGMPSKQESGDQYVVLRIETPPAHTDEQRELYQKMAQIMPFNPRKEWAVKT